MLPICCCKPVGRAVLLFLGVGWPLLLTGCGQKPGAAHEQAIPTSAAAAKPNEPFQPTRLSVEHLPNPWQIHPQVISGGLPEGDAAFQQLNDLGVQTVISVDGAKPDIALAKKYGLRYVHLPHGYDGIPAARVKELAKAVRDLPGPVYIHCHHGQHRSPAAAAVACIGAGLLDPSGGESFLRAAGTSGNYKGLYESAREARRFESRLLDELNVQFPEVAKLPPLAEAMVALEHTHDHLQLIAEAGWRSPAKHPDLEPAHEALLLREHFTELLRTEAVKQQPENFRSLVRASEEDSRTLENELRTWNMAGMNVPPPAAATKAFNHVSAKCKSCHTTYRDVPLSQKLPAHN